MLIRIGVVVAAVVASASMNAQPSSRSQLLGALPSVEAVYDDLITQEPREVRERYTEFPPQMKTELWVLQLKRYLSAHPELTPEQQSAIYEGIGILSSGVTGIDRSSSEWQVRVARPLLKLEADAKSAFDPVTFKLLFEHLGIAELASSTHAKFHAITLLYNCECSQDHDWCCVFPTCPEESCHVGVGYRCVFTQDGCGLFFMYPCDGLCA